MNYWIQEFKTGDNEGITASQDSLIVSILSAGTFFGALFLRRWVVATYC